jgi:hypothetical protein
MADPADSVHICGVLEHSGFALEPVIIWDQQRFDVNGPVVIVPALLQKEYITVYIATFGTPPSGRASAAYKGDVWCFPLNVKSLKRATSARAVADDGTWITCPLQLNSAIVMHYMYVVYLF